jgi:hypothetical protein
MASRRPLQGGLLRGTAVAFWWVYAKQSRIFRAWAALAAGSGSLRRWPPIPAASLHHRSSGPALLIGVLILFPIGFAVLRFFSYWVRLEALRQTAVLPENTIIQLALEQPYHDEKALPLPFTIKVRSTWKAPLTCFLLLTFPSCGLVALLFYEQPRNGRAALSHRRKDRAAAV